MKVTVIKDSVIHQGIIYKLDDSFEVDDSIAKSLEERGYVVCHQLEEVEVVETPIETVDESEVVSGSYDKEQLESMNYQDLKKLASDLGLGANGKKDELIEKILNVEVETDEIDESEDGLPDTSMPL